MIKKQEKRYNGYYIYVLSQLINEKYTLDDSRGLILSSLGNSSCGMNFYCNIWMVFQCAYLIFIITNSKPKILQVACCVHVLLGNI